MKPVILIFAFNRPLHLSKLLNSLFLNKESVQILIIIFIDGPRNNNDKKCINSVKKVINNYKVIPNL